MSEWPAGRVDCGEVDHLPGCWNPTPRVSGEDGCTACICGAMWWPGHVGTWHNTRHSIVVDVNGSGRPLYEDSPWGHYFMHAAGCADESVEPAAGHLCHPIEGAPAAEFWGRVSA